MKRPEGFDKVAAAFWVRHAKRLQDQGLLTDATYDSFVLLCRVHSLLSQANPADDPRTGTIKFVALAKQWTQLSRGFGMNSDKPKVPETQKEKDEYGI